MSGPAQRLLFAVLAFALACNRVEVTPEPAPAPAEPEVEKLLPPADSELSLEIDLDAAFHLDRREGHAMVLRITDVPDVEVWMVVGRDPMDGPMPSRDALVAKARAFLEPIHGEVSERFTAVGDALLTFDAGQKDGNRILHTVNWLLIRPGQHDVLRADVSLRMPQRWSEQRAMRRLAEHIGERLLEARFRPDR